jgi:linoleoyl-CoA desaturase
MPDSQVIEQTQWDPAIKFAARDDFHVEVRNRVDEFFRKTGRRRRDCPEIYIKTAILFTVFAGCYGLLVFVAQTWWQAAPLSLLLGLAIAGIGFNVQHDGAHQAFSNRRWVNQLMAMTLDVMGGSSYYWRWKHNFFHHTYCNIEGHDTDIDLGPLVRITPNQKWYWFHRWQHWYLWCLYGLLAIKWHLVSDFQEIIGGRIGRHREPRRPKRWDLLVFILGKLVFFTLAFGIPLLFHRFWVVLTCYAVVTVVLGFVLSVVFQLAHCVDQAEFPLPQPGTGRIENAWAVHQVETTVDFARRSRVAAWLLGGLNFQIEHHLFPRISHVNYPALSVLVEDVCREFGVKYSHNETFLSGVARHFRWLRERGLPQIAADCPGRSL